MAVSADIQQQVYDLLSKASNLSFVSADRDANTRLALTPGQRVTAEVLMTLPNDQVQVQVGKERFNLQLPMAVRQGQSLEMTFVSADPRSTFAIARPAGLPQPVSLSDASRLLGLLVKAEQIADPLLRSSLQSIGDLLRHSSGEAGVLANLMDEALTYGGALREGGKAIPTSPGSFLQQSPDQNRLAAFETNAAQILHNIARNSRVILAEAVNQPVVPLPFMPGEEVDATVLGTLPGGRVFVQVAGTSLELLLPRPIQTGEILRLTYISSLPKPLFALPRTAPEMASSDLSGAGRWMSALEHNAGGQSNQQMYVLERLNAVLKSLPADSPAFTAIQDEAITYQTLMQGRKPTEQAIKSDAAGAMTQQAMPLVGNGVVLSDDMAKLLQALIKGNRLALLEALNQQITSASFTPGQQIKGEVLALLGGGRFMVQVAEQTLEFNMPKGLKRGDLVNLFFITDEPRPTFLMARFGRLGDSRVSDTGRWLSAFLGATASRVPVQATMGILSTLLAEPPVDASQVGKMLQQGLRGSGLFYESHLARWFSGEYNLEDILREPQGRLSSLKQPTVMPQDLDTVSDAQARVGMKNNSMEVMEALFKKAGTAAQAHEGIADARTLSVVREQLDTLQSGQIVFRGELFPGQQMEWKVAEREARRNEAGGQERTWDTEMRLDLPKLGVISARLRLDGSRISIDLHAGDEEAIELLSNGRPALVEQLQAAGLEPGEIGVHHDAPRE